MTATTSNKYWLYFLPTNQARDTLTSFGLFSLFKLSWNWLWNTALNSKYKFQILYTLSFTFFTQRKIWSVHFDVLQKTSKKCTMNYDARTELLFSSINLLFSDVPFAVAVAVFLNSLISMRCRRSDAVVSWKADAVLLHSLLEIKGNRAYWNSSW